ncbi:MAG: hypothetical protein HYY10_01680 [Candidatus Liptonbacteria bacterium]|nr:hypothetical protein [Candidatus Liptonbacteria bacterium]
MKIYEAIETFNKQFAFLPKIENAARLVRRKKILVAGMGGSHLAADLLRIVRPHIDIMTYSDYGLPPVDIRDRLIIASSYSGNTEEAVSAFEEARRRELPCAVIAMGGKLLKLAKRFRVPYVQLPDLGLEPRMALGFSLMAFFSLAGDRTAIRDAAQLLGTLRPAAFESKGKKLAATLKGKVPIIYASARNAPLSYIWKIKFNETGKVPAYMNVLPELNHNEMNGFDVTAETRALSERFHFLFITDENDDPRVRKRMRILHQLYHARKLQATEIALRGKSLLERAVTSLVLADWAAYYTALGHGGSPDGVPIVEEFKRLIKE